MKFEVDDKPESAGDREVRLAKVRRVHYTKMAGILSLVVIVLVVFLVILILRRVPIGQARVEMNVVEIEEFKIQLDASTNPVIIDIREKNFFNGSRIPGAEWGEKKRCLEYGVETCIRKACSEKNEYFFYSDHGEEYHEVRNAIKRTSGRGCWSEVWLLDGGIQDWITAGYDLES